MKTTVICAVHSKDPDRDALLTGHCANLESQTSAPRIIYVFENKDDCWTSFTDDVRTVCLSGSVSIYQAWNVALSLVDTPYVMNLNLDDRLAPDAIAMLESAMEAESAHLVGGDWNVCYSQESTDDVRPCYPTSELPFVASDWPPPNGLVTRLGSSDGNRGTLGPATMWRMDCHVGAPRYPWRFVDGTPITSVGDSVWWHIIQAHQRHYAYRLPMVIGNYHSHPATQAEFRPHNEHEKLLVTAVSLI